MLFIHLITIADPSFLFETTTTGNWKLFAHNSWMHIKHNIVNKIVLMISNWSLAKRIFTHFKARKPNDVLFCLIYCLTHLLLFCFEQLHEVNVPVSSIFAISLIDDLCFYCVCAKVSKCGCCTGYGLCHG